ncbi:Nop52-domain-containing protein [Marasmius fiardii PR-910]|nr:Nop52-domain-containing protein [Marasmius fiardii PR-910]
MTTATMNAPLGKYLASTDKKTRDKAIKNLATFLSEPENEIPKAEMAKLWKGIFYCFWMSDKPLVQQALASELAELMLTVTTIPSSLALLGGFWETIVREWNGIDRLRMDKYYMLVRRFVNASFRLLLRNDWDQKTCEQYNIILTRQGGPLCPNDVKVPTSLAYHLSDIYLEELDKVLANIPSTSSSTPKVPLILLLTPFITLYARTPSMPMLKYFYSSLIEPLLTNLTPSDDREDESQRSRKRPRLESGATHGIYHHLVPECCRDSSISTVKNQILRKIFEVASEPETRDPNRRKMYDLWEKEKEDNDDDEDT